MIRTATWTVCVAVFAACLPQLAAQAPDKAPGDADKAKQLVHQLGVPSFAAREKAHAALVELGRPAKKALLEGAKDTDPEIRTRCNQILEIVLAIDFKARLAAFLADKEGKQEHDLAGWKRFRKLIGDDQPARELFVEMLKSNAQLMEDADIRPKDVSERVAYRCQYLMQSLYGRVPNQRNQITLGDIATMLFLGADPDIAVSENVRQLTCNFLYQPALRTAMSNGPRAAHTKKLLGAWMMQCAGTGMAQQVLSQAMQLEIKDGGLELALKLIKSKDYAGGMALTALGKWGGKEHMPTLEAMLDDKTGLGNFQINNVQGSTEIRDVALAMLVRLSGQQSKDYGFAFVQFHNEQQMFYIPIWMGFADEAKRTAAFKKWTDWKAAQKK